MGKFFCKITRQSIFPPFFPELLLDLQTGISRNIETPALEFHKNDTNCWFSITPKVVILHEVSFYQYLICVYFCFS